MASLSSGGVGAPPVPFRCAPRRPSHANALSCVVRTLTAHRGHQASLRRAKRRAEPVDQGTGGTAPGTMMPTIGNGVVVRSIDRIAVRPSYPPLPTQARCLVVHALREEPGLVREVTTERASPRASVVLNVIGTGPDRHGIPTEAVDVGIPCARRRSAEPWVTQHPRLGPATVAPLLRHASLDRPDGVTTLSARRMEPVTHAGAIGSGDGLADWAAAPTDTAAVRRHVTRCPHDSDRLD